MVGAPDRALQDGVAVNTLIWGVLNPSLTGRALPRFWNDSKLRVNILAFCTVLTGNLVWRALFAFCTVLIGNLIVLALARSSVWVGSRALQGGATVNAFAVNQSLTTTIAVNTYAVNQSLTRRAHSKRRVNTTTEHTPLTLCIVVKKRARSALAHSSVLVGNRA